MTRFEASAAIRAHRDSYQPCCSHCDTKLRPFCPGDDQHLTKCHEGCNAADLVLFDVVA